MKTKHKATIKTSGLRSTVTTVPEGLSKMEEASV